MKKQANVTHFFYQDGKLITVNQGQQHRAIFRAENMPLAEQQISDTENTNLLATDDKGSVFNVMNADEENETHTFTSYGHDPTLPSAKTLQGFNGERIEIAIPTYALGNGYRLFNTALMRFHSPDSFSPFGKGGFNAYAYCAGDPVNNTDPSGHGVIPEPIISFLVKYIDPLIDNLSDTGQLLKQPTDPNHHSYPKGRATKRNAEQFKEVIPELIKNRDDSIIIIGRHEQGAGDFVRAREDARNAAAYLASSSTTEHRNKHSSSINQRRAESQHSKYVAEQVINDPTKIANYNTWKEHSKARKFYVFYIDHMETIINKASATRAKK